VDSIERFHDIKSVGVLDEIEELIPEDKMEFFRTLKEKAAQEIKKDIENARNAEQKQRIFNALAGDHPEQFEAMNRFERRIEQPVDFEGIFDGIKQAMFERMRNRAEQISDEDRLQRYEAAFREKESLFRQEPPPDIKSFEDIFRE